MPYKLFLDDYRHPSEVNWYALPEGPYVVVKNYQEFVDHITQHGLPEFVSYDHDLADLHYLGKYTTEYTGYDCAKWLLEYCKANGLQHPRFAVHSMNPVGKQRILNLFDGRRS